MGSFWNQLLQNPLNSTFFLIVVKNLSIYILCEKVYYIIKYIRVHFLYPNFLLYKVK